MNPGVQVIHIIFKCLMLLSLHNIAILWDFIIFWMSLLFLWKTGHSTGCSLFEFQVVRNNIYCRPYICVHSGMPTQTENVTYCDFVPISVYGCSMVGVLSFYVCVCVPDIRTVDENVLWHGNSLQRDKRGFRNGSMHQPALPTTWTCKQWCHDVIKYDTS